MEEEEGVVMPLYWACQEVQAKLQDQPQDNRKNIISRSITDHMRKFEHCKDKLVFDSNLTWFNTNSPINRDSLQGYVTVIDFFTYCCINCMHILPDLEKLEKTYPEGLAIVGVHSAKFTNEKAEYQLENAIKRYSIEHPVCNDVELKLWNNLGVTCWPTLLVLSPSGIPIHVFIGEGHSQFLNEYIHTAITHFKDAGALTSNRLPRSIQSKITGSNLKYPGKICLLKDSLVVSDSGNNRVLIIESSSDGPNNVAHVIGGRERGCQDGDFNVATFNNPQGVTAIGEDLILVADTDNHLIRQIDLKSKLVSTVGGTGVQGQDKEGGRPGLQQEISSPWDLARISESCVAVAMAGIHQIWLYCLEDVSWWKGAKYPAKTLVRIVGSGAEENRNNSYPAKAGLAQPSGLSHDPSFNPAGAIYVADSESSTVRRIDLKDGCVKNVCGGERDPLNLFGYGDADGAGVNAKLQHPLAVAWNQARGELYVADSYNHKIKKVTGPKNDTVTVFGGEPGNASGDIKDARLCEPGGLCLSEDGNILYIADTNNHCIKKFDIEAGVVTTLDIKFPGSKSTDDNVIVHTIDAKLEVNTILNLKANLKHPDLKLNTDAKSKWTLEESDNVESDSKEGEISGEIAIPVKITGEVDAVSLKLRCKMYLCTVSSGLCLAKSILHIININSVNKEDTGSISLGSLISGL
eukprot:TRINITY_DN3669_c0_g1_i3.p1 TRINITY_DN3669_c0_g1~~TRINITY_DN3669_c0_g1_i3.p1  ORF type:complete len:691 (+),score=87.46 TRINITY_DN3669_c0_g1_i3:231-2303(+)